MGKHESVPRRLPLTVAFLFFVFFFVVVYLSFYYIVICEISKIKVNLAFSSI